MNADACLIESSKTTLSLAPQFQTAQAQAGPFAYTLLHTKPLCYSECAGHA